MMNSKQEAANRQIKSVTNIGIVVNIALAVIKVVIGLLAGSMSLIADGIHSLSDLATDVVVLVGVRLGSKEPDIKHPYGHGRIETYAAALVALVLALVGGGMVYFAARDIAEGKKAVPHIVVLLAALLSVGAKEWLYWFTRKTAISTHSPLLYANAWHHRSDAFSSVAVVIGFISLELGFGYADEIAGIAVGLMIVLAGIKVLSDCLSEMTERAVDEETIEQVKSVISANKKIKQFHKLRSRTIGRQVFLDFHILVDPALNVAEAHEISEDLENAVNAEISRPVNITIHIEPDIPELRK